MDMRLTNKVFIRPFLPLSSLCYELYDFCTPGLILWMSGIRFHCGAIVKLTFPANFDSVFMYI